MVSVRSIHKSFKVRSKTAAPKKPGAAEQAPGFEIRNGRIHILSDVSFEAKPGEIYGLLGPNGAGKTTTLRCVATLLKADSGAISVMDKDVVRDAKAVRASIGLLTSDMKLAGNLSPRYLLSFFGELNHLDKETIARRGAELADYLGMKDFLDRPIEKCSTGQKQKTSIAVSLIHDPQVIIFDEPTNGLDILAAKTVVDFLRDFRDRGKTIILSTHIMTEAETLCDRIGIMLNGKIVAEGSNKDLQRQYAQDSLEKVFFHIAEKEGVWSRA